MAGIYFVYDGTVKVHKHWGKDKELILRFAKKGVIVGHRGLGQDAVYPISATAIDQVTMCFVPLDFFQPSPKVNHNLLYQLMMFYASELQESEKNMRDLIYLSVKERLIKSLLFLKNRFGLNEHGCIDLDLSRHNLASFIGTSYETVFRMLNELAEENYIRITGKKVCLLENKKPESLDEWSVVRFAS